MVRFTRGCGTK